MGIENFDKAMHALLYLKDEKDQSNGAPTVNALLAHIVFETLMTAEDDIKDLAKQVAQCEETIQTLRAHKTNLESQVANSQLIDGAGIQYWHAEAVRLRGENETLYSHFRENEEKILRAFAGAVPEKEIELFRDAYAFILREQCPLTLEEIAIVIWYAKNNEKIQAIKMMRSFRKMGLADSRNIIGNLADSKNTVENFIERMKAL